MDARTLAKLFDLVPEGILILGPNYQVVYANEPGKGVLSSSGSNEGSPGFERRLKPLLPQLWPKGHKYFPVQGLIQTEAGPATVRGSGSSCNGELQAALLVISQARTPESGGNIASVRQRMEELEEILGASYDEILVTDGRGVVIYANSAFERHYGVPVREVLGKQVTELEKDGVWKPSVTPMVIKSRQRITIQQQTAIGKVMIVTGTPVLDQAGRVKMVVCNARDITEMSKLESELEKTKDLIRIYQKKLASQKDGDFIVARSTRMQNVMELAEKVSRADVTVLLRGESGVGKDVVARAIHRMGSRRDRLFLKVSCAAIPENLMEAELFGYRPGAFTGALRQGKAGLIEIAQGGTIFLDEIGELPPGLQAKLLQVLDEKQFLKLGDTRPTAVEVRIVAATNRDLERMIHEGHFRRDLFHRLNAVSILIPPIRERKEDIIALSHYYLEAMNRKYQTQKSFSSKAMKALLAYRWPGNVRELANLVEHLVLTVDRDVIGLSDLPQDIAANQMDDHPLAGLGGAASLPSALAAFEEKLIREAFQRCESTYQVAKILGISQSAAYRKWQKYVAAGKREVQGVGNQ